ncbi:hypothetical protein [Halorussus salinus]|nr:hypothetical protein [Halorussus salinus]
MGNVESNSSDETENDEQREARELETVTREGDWGSETFRDAGEVTFGNR